MGVLVTFCGASKFCRDAILSCVLLRIGRPGLLGIIRCEGAHKNTSCRRVRQLLYTLSILLFEYDSSTRGAVKYERTSGFATRVLPWNA